MHKEINVTSVRASVTDLSTEKSARIIMVFTQYPTRLLCSASGLSEVKVPTCIFEKSQVVFKKNKKK